MTKPMRLATALITILLAGLVTVAADGATGTHHPAKQAAAKVESYVVMKDGENVRVAKKSELAAAKKKALDDYKAAQKSYQEARKGAGKSTSGKSADAAKAHDKPEKPVKRTVVDLAKKSFKTEEDAKAWLEEYQQKQDENKTGKKADASQ
jgi:hypothetical protein